MTRGAPLPIDGFLDRITDHLYRSRAVVVTAQPGAGKTTRVPPALVDDGPVILLQPRRVAARAIAARIAEERGWTLGREVGWQVRFERRFGADTRLLVVTEGVLSARLQTDPLLSGFRTIVLDEFHERSVHADLAIALAKQAWLARDDLRIVVMSATLDTKSVSIFLAGCPIVDVPGRLHSLEISYAPGQGVAESAIELFGRTDGDVLCFLPGAPEIQRTIADLHGRIGTPAIDIVALHGSLDADAQDAALALSPRRRIVVATNIAETSITVPGVTAVVDSGWHKVARYDAGRAIDSLELERITADAAEQRAGRAGRVCAGVVRRLWDSRDRLRAQREPEIRRVDLAATVLDVIAWGADPEALDWFEAPPRDALEAARTLLERLGLINAGKLTRLGDRVRRLPIHPRLGRMLAAAEGARDIARACAVVSERHLLPPRTASTSSDLLSAVDNWTDMPWHVQRVASHIESIAAASLPLAASPPSVRGAQSENKSAGVRGSFDHAGTAAAPCPPHQPALRTRHNSEPAKSARLPEVDFRRAIFSGYPDRVAQRRAPQSPRLLLASGAGAALGRESGVNEGEFLVAIDIQARAEGDAIVRLASRVEREWLQPNASERVHKFDRDSGTVKATLVERYDALVLAERPAPADEDAAVALLAEQWFARAPAEADQRLLRRLSFAGHNLDLSSLVRTAARGVRALKDVRLERALEPGVLRSLDRDAPDTIVMPSGRATRLEYAADGSISASVKLQEVFGLAETPRVGGRNEPVVLALLAPNGRAVQLTRDLRSFWNRTYPEVRKELRGRYPKHPWPEDPWSATPTARAKKSTPRGRQ